MPTFPAPRAQDSAGDTDPGVRRYPVDSWPYPVGEMEVVVIIIVSTSLCLVNHTKEK